jgi:hypothetical protein
MGLSMISIVFLLLLKSESIKARSEERKSVAICICGQIARWMPEGSINGLVHDMNKNFDLYFFYKLGKHAQKTVYSTRPDMATTTSSPMYSLSKANITNTLLGMLTGENSYLASLWIDHHQRPAAYWRKLMAVAKLDRIIQYQHNQENILDMYKHQVDCAQQISLYEKESMNQKFDHVIFTRDDAYYFKPVDLNVLQRHLTNEDIDCHLVSKNCLQWGGINMRWQMMNREHLENFYGSRLDFYEHMIATNNSVHNPEMFEKLQLEKHLGLKACNVSVDDVPVTAARYSTSKDNKKIGDLCLLFPYETRGCVPDDSKILAYTKTLEAIKPTKDVKCIALTA